MKREESLSKNSIAQNETFDHTNLYQKFTSKDLDKDDRGSQSPVRKSKGLNIKPNGNENNVGKKTKRKSFSILEFIKSFGKKETKPTRENTEEAYEESSGDEKLSKAFGVDLSYTRTPKVDTNQTESDEFENPDIEQSMLKDELRMLKFLNDDEDEVSYLKNSTRFIDQVKNDNPKPEQKKTYISEMSLNPTKVTVIKNNHPEIAKVNYDVHKSNVEHLTPQINHIYIEDRNYQGSGRTHIIHKTEEIRVSEPYARTNLMLARDENKQHHNHSAFYHPYESDMKFSIKEEMLSYTMNYDYCTHQQPYQSYGYQRTNSNKLNYNKNDDRSEFDILLENIYNENKTTLMIRNIPNKYTKELMLETIDEEFKDTYDFFYLPIDFHNNCNVGYAFINFKSLKHIELFYKRFNNSKWPIFNSEKICSIKYARIQGKNECTNHFQGTSLMRQTVR